jgi:glycosyltransferase involved in cell wall biosynthesis
MIYYFLPDSGIFGGVKVACQFADLLHRLGVPASVVLPGGKAPQWFPCQAAVWGEEQVRPSLSPSDWLMITWPPDYHRLQGLPAPLICHCQGTDELMDPIFADHRVPVLTCWQQATNYVVEHFGRSSVEVGIAISDCFFWDGGLKFDTLVSFMPRRGFPNVRKCLRRCPRLDFMPLDGLPEGEVARKLKQAGVFLATALGEQFGLPALEAMAAGCVVLSVPVKGGMEYLNNGENCLVVEPEQMAECLEWVTQPENRELRARMRSRAVATAMGYRISLQRERLSQLLRGELSWLRHQVQTA